MSLKDKLYDALSNYKNNIAIQDDVSKITYAELDERSEKIAASIHGKNMVGVISSKNISTVVSYIACVKAKVAYVPIDQGATKSRKKEIISDAGISVVINGEIIEDIAHIGRDSVATTQFQTQYVLYTSGSTGKPKGVPISAKNAIAFINWACEALPLYPSDIVLNVSPLHFDLSVYDIYCSLLNGATLILASEKTCSFPNALAHQIKENKITVLYVVPTVLNRLVKRSTFLKQAPESLRRIMYAGEPLNNSTYEAIKENVSRIEMYNLYGPIETNVITYKEIQRDMPFVSTNIGRPCGHVDILIVDEYGSLVKDKQEGELVVAGESVTNGYLNDDERNEKQFIKLNNKIFYRTGDIVSLNEKRELILHGRRDGMIKTRGIRVEIGDVEVKLQKLKGVAEIVVIAIPDKNITNKLIAFYIPAPDQNFDPACASMYLPDHMVPEQFYCVKELPQTSTGKIDRNLLKEKGIKGLLYE